MKISELPELTALLGDEYLPIVQNGTTYKIAASLLGGSGTPPVTGNTFDDEFDGATLNAAWQWQNQGLSTVSLSGGFLNLAKPPSGSTQNQISCLFKILPAAPWTVTARFLVSGSDITFTNQGLMIGDSFGRITTLNSGWGSSARRQEIYNFTNPNTFSSAAKEANVTGVAGSKNAFYFARITNDGTNLRFYTAGTEAELTLTASLFYTRAMTSFLSAVERIGFNMESRNGTAGLQADWIKLVKSV